MFDPEDDRVLILIQLNGGNDGLNTVIPLDQYGELFNLRENIIIPESKAIKIEDHVGLHPAFANMASLYSDDKLAIIQGVAYPNQNRSHFRSLDIWQTASGANEFLSSGWAGRYLDTQHIDYPTEYPNETYPDPIAISIGFQLSETCQGLGSNYSIALSSESSLQSIGNSGNNEYESICYTEQVSFIQESIVQLNAYSAVVNGAFESGKNQVEYPADRFAEQLRLIAKLISGGLGTKIYVANLGGFDTHANQVDQTDSTAGGHAELLKRLSDGIFAFQKDMEAQGLEERVVGMTYSEFGRRIKSNGSFGSDHGTAAPMIVFGNCVNGGIIGNNVNLSREILDNTGVEMQHDFRSVYASILMDWFGAEESQLREILFDDFSYIPIVSECLSTETFDHQVDPFESKLYPNPASDYCIFEYKNVSGNLQVEIFDTKGTKVKAINQQSYDGKIEISIRSLPPGGYYIRVNDGNRATVKKLIKV
jgi:uncharacterized protein (DUF1501 family)